MFRTEFVWIAVFLAVGVVGGLVFNWPESDVDTAAPTETKAPEEEKQPANSEGDSGFSWQLDGGLGDNPQVTESDSPAESANKSDEVWNEITPPMKRTQPVDLGVIELGDRLLLGGNYGGALKHYSKLWKTSNAPMNNKVLLRLAMATELGGLDDEAIKHYRSAIRVSERGSVAQATGLLGIARIWERRGQINDATSLLSELHLLYGNEQYPKLLRGQVVAQLADCLQRRLLGRDVVIEALSKEPIEYFWPSPTVDILLTLIDWEAPADAMVAPPSQLQILQAPRPDASLILVGANVRGMSLLGLIGELERRTELHFELTEKAKADLVGRMSNIQTTAMPVSLLLDSVLEATLLAWSQSETEITIMHRDELLPRDLASYDLGRTQRMLRQVQLEHAEGPRRTSSIMNEGNNARLSGGWETARDKYKMARDQVPAHELSAKLYFNEASLQLAEGDKVHALNSCYMALDQTVVASLKGDVYAMIAELELEMGQTDRAITAASRGLRRTQDPQVLGRCVLSLARAYLLSGDPDSANQMLFDNSANLVGDSERRVASVFSAFARFQRMPPGRGLQDEGQRLVLALAALMPTDATSFADSLIIAQAFASVGLRTNAIDNLESALTSAPAGYWAERIRLELAKTYYDAGNLQAADATINGFGQVSMNLLPDVLMLQANVNFDANQLDVSESICRRILSMRISEDRQKEALNVLGKILNRKGNHYAATLCFAGLLPEPIAADNELNSQSNPGE